MILSNEDFFFFCTLVEYDLCQTDLMCLNNYYYSKVVAPTLHPEASFELLFVELCSEVPFY